MSVSVEAGGSSVYSHKETTPRTPASNEKLLLSMAILDKLGPGQRIDTRVAANSYSHGVVAGPLWILGGGDPGINTRRISSLAHAIVKAGVTKITGAIKGSTGYFSRDWFAKGWKKSFRQEECALPTALTFNGNSSHGRNIRDPEKLAAVALTKKLRGLGVRVGDKAGAGSAPSGLSDVALIKSKPLKSLLHIQNVGSVNFYAEVLGKLLGAKSFSAPGTFAKGAKAIETFASSAGANVTAYDSSGLSYADRVSTEGMVKMLSDASGTSWGDDLRETLAKPGQGTLAGRLHGLNVRAKTGTLNGISALSGWVELDSTHKLAEFSILSKGMPKTTAMAIEDKIVALIAHNA
jgi:D-alanyl-D-alanine carboxypeptidase/D-alanyl-D-alanine-endopeptidase (penicillin-binding protein 4)